MGCWSEISEIMARLGLDGRTATIHIQFMTKAPRQSSPRSKGKREVPARGYRSPIQVTIDRDALAEWNKRAIAAQVGIGVVAGWLASWLVGGTGLLRYVLTGLLGSLVGAFLLEHLGVDLGIRSPLANRIVTATLGAVIVVVLAKILS
jgi:uncharacterized membrane protein YeaQ/YmgE (transglycosylase-associated protein family)